MNNFRMRVGLAAAMAALLAGAGVGVATANPGLKVVRYHGYRVRVPSSWPVVNLAAHPTTCVRFDRHALYLGTPGAREACPGSAIGRSEAILVEPVPRMAAARLAASLAPASGTAVAVPSAGVVVVATWSGHPATIERALGHPVSASAPTPLSRVPASHMSVRAATNAASAPSTTLGFDTCAAPSTAAMAAWGASPYRTIGVYLGGANSACAQPNLTPAWVRTVTGAGWRLIPTYVGLQGTGSCGNGCADIVASQASAEGVAAAIDAVGKAEALGIPPGNPIYDDMEQYTTGGTRTAAVLAYLASWTTELHTLGYTSGVYSSAASGISDLVHAVGTNMVEPDELWVADWNNLKSTSDPWVPAGDWTNHQRLHQYQGGHNETYGGTTLDIDNDYIDGATAGTGAFPPPDGSFVSYQGKAYELVGGAPVYVSSWSAVGGARATLALTALQWRVLRALPADGTLVRSTASGSVYEIVGGSPMYVHDVAGIAGSRTPIGIDQWDLSNLANPAAHMRGVPADGTFITAAQTGRIYRIVGDAPIPVSAWTVFGGIQPSDVVDAWDVLHPANPSSRLHARPVNGARVRAALAGTYWLFASGYRIQTRAANGAIAVDDAGLVTFAVAPPCRVPHLAHLTLAQARSALAKAFCALGAVRHPAVVARGHVLRVMRQSVTAGTRHPTLYHVKVTLV